MRKLIKRQRKKPGLSPGTLIHVGEQKTEKIEIKVHVYNEHDVSSFIADSADKIPEPSGDNVTWIQINGIHDVDMIGKIGKRSSLHSLLLEDILNTEQRPKVEDFTDYLFVVLKALSYDETAKEVRVDQVSLVIGNHYVISFHEHEKGLFDPVRERIESGKGRIRKMGSDYLAYALIDIIVDTYFLMLEKFGEAIESLEQSLINEPRPESLHAINTLKREMIFLRKNIWPLREVVTVMERRESPLIKQHTVVYLRDLYDHTIQVIDTIETMRDILTGMLDVYLSSMSNKTNEVIKVLTIIATIFIPLTFIVGIYGMNFEYMPELEWRWAYPGIMGMMALVVAGMLVYFRRRKWI